MNTKAVAFFAAFLGFASPIGKASPSHVSRCVTADGSAMYTDGSCRALGANTAPMSVDLVRNLVREGALGGGTPGTAAGPSTMVRGSSRVDIANQCARTPAQLAAALRSSLSAGDVNELAGIYDWHNMSGKQSKPVLKRLQQMSDRPLIDGRFFANGQGQSTVESGVVQLVQGADAAPTVTELAVVRRSGCLLLAF